MSHAAGTMVRFKVACDECATTPEIPSNGIPPLANSVLGEANMPLFPPIFSLCCEIRESQAFVCELEGRSVRQFHLYASLSLSPSAVSALACTTSHECEQKLCLAEQKASCLLLALLLTVAYAQGITHRHKSSFCFSSVLQRLK